MQLNLKGTWLFGLFILIIGVHLASQYPYFFDDAFISFRITEQILKNVKPYFSTEGLEYTSTSVLYPFLNCIWASLFGKNWVEWIPIFNAIFLSLSFFVVFRKAISFAIQDDFKLKLLVFLGILPLFLEFRNFQYGNSGLETCFYMVLLSFFVVPEHSKIEKPNYFGGLLIFLRPEGVLAGFASILNALFKGQIKPGIRLIFISIFTIIGYLSYNWLIYHQLLPQSMIAKSNHIIFRTEELKKGFAYLLFSGLWVYMGIFLLNLFLNPLSKPKIFGLTFIWVILYISFFSLFAAWWPWYVPPLFVAYWFIAANSLIGIYEYSLQIKLHNRNGIYWFAVLALFLFSAWKFEETRKILKKTSFASKTRIKSSEKIGTWLNQNANQKDKILIEPIGMVGWFAKNLSFLDYPGLSHKEMASFISKLHWKVPHRLTDRRTDSAILYHFRPDIIVLWREEKAAFEKIERFQHAYFKTKTLPYFLLDERMDSVFIYRKR